MGVLNFFKRLVLGEDYIHEISIGGVVNGRWHKLKTGSYVCAECKTYMTPNAGPGGTPLCSNRNGCKYGM